MRLAAAVLLVAAVARADLSGTWELEMTRDGWTPAVCRGRLVLRRAGREWQGHLTWDVLMGGRKLRLSDIKVKGDRFSCAWDVERFKVRMEGRLKGRKLAGKLTWTGSGAWPFAAEREGARKPGKVVRIDDGSFANFFQRATPEEAGIDAAALDRLIGKAQAADTDALLILKDRRVVCERYFTRNRGPIHTMSVTKFVTSLAAARLIDQKKLKLDEPLGRWFKPWKTGDKGTITVRQLLAHTTGLVHPRMAHTLNKQDDKVDYAMRLPVKAPGTRCAYSNEGIALLSGVLEQAAGEPVDAYVKREIFEPLTIRDFKWDRDKAGHTITYAQLALTARDLARLGQLCADGGGEILSARVIGEFAQPGSKLDKHRGLIWRLWDEPNGFGHTGWLGQFIVVYPELGLVGVRLRRARRDLEHAPYSFGAFPALLADLAAP
ncbi:MAG: serine hydrolase domain-containing protein [Planctomycetota bacterium]|jgi:CubicO group peptidase (beta-lactamase class C family)